MQIFSGEIKVYVLQCFDVRQLIVQQAMVMGHTETL